VELTIEDIRTLIGSYVLELTLKDKEINQLRKTVEELQFDKARVHAFVESVKKEE
jgi:hypothetical protein